MRVQWTFKVVLGDYTHFSVRRSNGSFAIEGTADEALNFAAKVREHYRDRPVIRVEAHSPSPIPTDGTSTRQLFWIRPHPNRRDWVVDETSLAHPAWLPKLEDAVSLLAFRARGYISQIQVVDFASQTTRVILINQQNDDCFRSCAPTQGPGRKAEIDPPA